MIHPVICGNNPSLHTEFGSVKTAKIMIQLNSLYLCYSPHFPYKMVNIKYKVLFHFVWVIS
jgi:hypothetical protein